MFLINSPSVSTGEVFPVVGTHAYIVVSVASNDEDFTQ